MELAFNISLKKFKFHLQKSLLPLTVLAVLILFFYLPAKSASAAIIFEQTSVKGYWNTFYPFAGGSFCTYTNSCTSIIASTNTQVLTSFLGEHAFTTATGTVVGSIRLSLAKDAGLPDPGRLVIWCDNPASNSEAVSTQYLKSADLDQNSFKVFQFDFPTSQCTQIRGLEFETLGDGWPGLKVEVSNVDSKPFYGVGNVQWAGGLNGFGVPSSSEKYEPYIQVADKAGFPTPLPYEGKTPVLIVPGLLGTEISKDQTLLWADITRMVNPVNDDSFMDDLSFNENLSPLNENLKIKEVITKKVQSVGQRELTLYDYADGLINTFTSTNQGYTKDKDLFTFPYDWRFGVSEDIVNNLQQKIQEIITQTGSKKVDIIAHSTGGLIVKKYITEHPNDHHIDKAVFVGVPNLGAPKAIKVLLQGDNFGVNGLEDSEMQKIAKNAPISYDLSPSQEYANQNGSYVKIVTAKSFSSKVENLNFSQIDDFLTNYHDFNNLGLTKAHNLHTSSFDNFDMRSAGVDLYSIVGCKRGTIGAITEYRNQGQVFTSVTGYTLDDVTGDGTVPMSSAATLHINGDHQFYAINADHGKMPSQDGIRQTIVNIISGSSLPTGSDIISNRDLVTDPTKCKLKGHWYEVFSPISIEITDQNNNRAGLADDGSIQNDIPGADYEVVGEHKFIFLPTDAGQVYSTKFKGTGQGTFTFKDSAINNDASTQTQVFSNLPVTAALKGTVNLGSITTLSLDNNGDGTVDQTVQPSAVINSSESQDLIPPVSTSTITGSLGQPGFYRSNVTVQLSALDPKILGHGNETSGLLKTVYNLDNSGYQIYSSSTPVSITTEGPHVLTFFSTDKAGNNEQEQTINFTIDKTAPEFVIQFNPDSKDLTFSGVDNISTTSKVTILDNDDLVTATDQAGNITKLALSDNQRKIKLKAEIKTLSYNNLPVDLTKNKFVLTWGCGLWWACSKNTNLQSITQRVVSKKDFNITADFSLGKTTITGKDQSGKINKTLPGLILLKVYTNKGDFNWTF